MLTHDLGTYLGYLGSALGVAMVVPQILRTLRHRQMAGVSALSWSLTVTSCTLWMLYGFRAHETVQIPGNILLVSGAIVVVLLVPARLPVAARACALAVVLAMLFLLATQLPPRLIGVVATAIGVSSTLPQVIKSVRRPADAPSAVAIPTWVMRVFSQGSWIGFAVLCHDPVVLASAVFTETCNVTVLTAELRRVRALHSTPALVAA